MTLSGGLRGIIVRQLFGLRDYEIEVEAQHPTVLTGANGTGKSTVLKLVNAVSSGDMSTMLSAPLAGFELHFNDIPPFILNRLPSDRGIEIEWGPYSDVVKPLTIPGDIPDWAVDVLSNPLVTYKKMEELLSEAARAAGVRFADFRALTRSLRLSGRTDEIVEPPDWLTTLSEQFPVLFITDQRLVVESKAAPSSSKSDTVRLSRLAVEAASSDIANRMRHLDSVYARSSQMQDRSFPRDVINAMSQADDISLETLQELLFEVDSRRESLRAVGLLDIDRDIEPDLTTESLNQQHVRPVIAAFLRSTIKKLEVLEDLSKKLRIFKAFLDERFAQKTMTLNRQDGFKFELSNGSSITPGQLSSGEQQMLVLAYEILFRAREGTLVIVDEPEISLHVLWQDTLIDNLTSMGEANNIQFLMASHSPVLLGAHPELERSLDQVGRVVQE
ncbi:AAA family ATPase [Saccharothrix isguenensis]